MWERVEGESEPWEREAFDGAAVESAEGEELTLGVDERWPMERDIARDADAMRYAEAVLEYWSVED